MQAKAIDEYFTAAAQITPEDVPAIAAKGFRTIMSNRPDGEDPGQPPFEEIEAAARAAGLEAVHLPVVSGQMTEDDVEAFRAAVAESPGPIFAYCRSGTRSRTLRERAG